jgi:hypothetical protein
MRSIKRRLSGLLRLGCPVLPCPRAGTERRPFCCREADSFV